MEFFLAIFFLLFYYIRPQDWVPGLAGFRVIKPLIAIWAVVLHSNRSQPPALAGILRTPHDWLMYSYYAYVVVTSPNVKDTLIGFLPLVVFYAFTVQSITSWDRLRSYLEWWNRALIVLAILAVASLWGIDFTGAEDATANMLDRLCIGTHMHDNPNALAHSVVVIVPTSYFLYFWKGTIIQRLVFFPFCAFFALYCIYETESKGGYLAGAILLVLIFVVGRPKFVQIIAIALALTVGLGALSFLPRMGAMGNLRSDEGVQGRLLAWEVARDVTKTEATGEGWGQHLAFIRWKEGNKSYLVAKSSHSSYVQIAAELGKYGLFLYIAVIWTALHTLIRFRPGNDTEHRCRRILLIFILGSLISGWMINREYHTEFFLMIAATAALHRLKLRDQELKRKEEEEDEPKVDSEFLTGGSPAWLPASLQPPVVKAEKPFWNRFGVVDLVVAIGMTWFTFWFWDYLLVNV